MSAVWKHSPCKENKLLTLLAIADNANDDGWAYPSQNTLAKKVRVTRRAMQKILDQLETDGEIVVYNRVDPTNLQLHYSNVYHLPKYGISEASAPTELRGFIRAHSTPSQWANTLEGSIHRDTTVAYTETLPSVHRDTTVAYGGMHESSLEPSLESLPEAQSARESTPVPHHIANGLGRTAPTDKIPLVKAIEDSAVYKAYVRGWDGIAPVLAFNTEDIAHKAVKRLEYGIQKGDFTLDDIEETTRWKCNDPKQTLYPIGFVISDIPNWQRWKRAQANKPHPASVRGAGLKPALTSSVPAPTTSLGAPNQRGKQHA